MSSLHLVLGGIRSGKSAFAEALAAERAAGRPVLYVATGQAADAEMTERIRRHRQRRPAEWQTVEAPLNPVAALQAAAPHPANPPLLLLDSLDGWVSNLLLDHESMPATELEARAIGAARRLATFIAELCADAIVVSSEVGHSLVATSSLGRQFQDLLGAANQAMAAAADEVTLVTAGIPTRIKPHN